MKNIYGIYGASGFGREVMPLARRMLEGQQVPGSYELLFVDDGDEAGSKINGIETVTYRRFVELRANTRNICIAIANAAVREEISTRCQRDGVLPYSVFAGSAVFLDSNEIGPGSIFCSFSQVTSNARIGSHFHANIYSYVAHDCIVGNFVTLAPGAKINGNVVLEDGAYIGTGAIIKQGAPGNPIIVGKGATVGMGAVVTRSVGAGVTVVGNPAKPIGR